MKWCREAQIIYNAVSLVMLIIMLVILMAQKMSYDRKFSDQAELIAIEDQIIQEEWAIIERYEKILQHIFQGQWDPTKAVRPEFVEDWYGTPIYTYKMVDGNPGDPITTTLAEKIDQAIEKMGGQR